MSHEDAGALQRLHPPVSWDSEGPAMGAAANGLAGTEAKGRHRCPQVSPADPNLGEPLTALRL